MLVEKNIKMKAILVEDMSASHIEESAREWYNSSAYS